MRCRQFLRVIAQKVGAHIGFSGIIMGHGGVQLRRKHFTLHRAVRLGGLLQLQGQDRTHQLIRVALGAEEIAQREGDKASPPVRCGQPLGILQHMRMGAHDDICTPVCQILRQCALTVHDGVAVLYAPVHSHHHKICLLTRQAHLPLDHIGLAGVDDIGCHILILADTVGVFSIGEIGDGHTVDGLQRDAVVVLFAAPQTGGDYILRHGLPELLSSRNAGRALIIGVVIGQAEHPHPGTVQRPRTVAGGGKAWVGGGCKGVAAKGLLIDPVHILFRIERSNVLIAVIKAVLSVFACPAGGLIINGRMDQVISCCGKTDGFHHRLRFRFRLRGHNR